jgi:hypothetical protein
MHSTLGLALDIREDMTDVCSDLLMFECFQRSNWHLMSIKRGKVLSNSLICGCTHPWNRRLTPMKKWQMYVAIHWFVHVANLRIGIGCPSKAADVVSNSLICECMRDIHEETIDAFSKSLICACFQCMFSTFELALDVHQKRQMHFTIHWFVDAFDLGMCAWHTWRNHRCI